MTLRLLGDVHGDQHTINDWLSDYLNYDLNISVGDFGIGFGASYIFDEADPNRFKICAGNHDNYSLLKQHPHNLGDFGVFEFGDKKIFFVRGARSIDAIRRTPGIDWWPDEELDLGQSYDCLDLWEKECDGVDFVISHDCPLNATNIIHHSWPEESHTGTLLWHMWRHHEPPAWYFGHHHRDWSQMIGRTYFHCLNIGKELVIEC